MCLRLARGFLFCLFLFGSPVTKWPLDVSHTLETAAEESPPPIMSSSFKVWSTRRGRGHRCSPRDWRHSVLRHVISFVFMFWTKEFVARRHCRLIHCKASLKEEKKKSILVSSQYKPSWHLPLILLRHTEHNQLLCANFHRFFPFLCFCLLFSSGFRTVFAQTWHFLHPRCFAFIFSNCIFKKSKNAKTEHFFFLMTWVQWLCSLLYLWETILYILALDSLNWRTWQIPLEHNEYD